MRFLALCFSLLVFSGNAQEASFFAPKDRVFEINIRKSGPFVGIQRGQYTVLELGGENIWKKVRLSKPLTHAVHGNFNYNFKYNVLGFDAGYWIRPHRFGLTYGASLIHRTDFTQHKLGLAPCIGYKLWMMHLRVGYSILPKANDFETNTFFVSLRAGIINDRDVDFVWNGFGKKKKKK